MLYAHLAALAASENVHHAIRVIEGVVAAGLVVGPGVSKIADAVELLHQAAFDAEGAADRVDEIDAGWTPAEAVAV